MKNITSIKHLILNIFSSGKYSSEQDNQQEKMHGHGMSDKMSDYMIRYILMNFVHIFGFTVLVFFIIQNMAKGSYFDTFACLFMALIAASGFILSRTKVIQIVPAYITIISYGLFCILLIWNGDAQGAGFLSIYIYPLLTIILLGMKNGIIFSIILLIIVIIEAFIPGASRFNYHLDISIRMVAAYVLVLTITLVLETSRKNKDKLNERLMLELKGSIDDLACANNEIENQKNELRNYNENLEKMVQEKIKTIVVLKNAVMETIADLVERRDKTTGGHISRTSNYMRIFIDEIIKEKLYQEQTALWNKEEIVLSAQLHDVGKIGIDDIILLKPAKLSAVEFEVMKNHTLMGGEIIKEIQQKTGESEFLDFAFIFAVYHHEKWNGTGYPYRISRKKIPLPARIMSIIDVYDALISLRPYKEPLSHEEAIKIINEEKSTSFDPALTELFISISSRFKEVG